MKNNSFTLVLFLILTSLLLIIPGLFKANMKFLNESFLYTNLIIGIISIVMIVISCRNFTYSFQIIHWVFHYSFFFIAPLAQYLNNSFLWGKLSLSNTTLLFKANLIIILWQIIWIIVNRTVSKGKQENQDIKNNNYYTSHIKLYILFILSLLCIYILLQIYGVGGLLTRGSDLSSENQNSSISLILSNSSRSIPVIFLVLSILNFKYKPSFIYGFCIFISFCLAIFANFPLATPRFWTAAVTIGLIIFSIKIKNSNILVYLLIFGLNVVFPLLATSRRAKSISEYFNTLDFNRTLSNNLLIGDYDAYSMIAYTIRYIEVFGHSMGKQLGTVLLFFVPRSMWQDKSNGSGKVISKYINLQYDNVSSPLPAEGLINYGLAGLIFFAIFFALITSLADNLYWTDRSPLLIIIYPFIIGFFFFMLRGDLLSSFSYTLSFVIPFIIFRPKIIKYTKE